MKMGGIKNSTVVLILGFVAVIGVLFTILNKIEAPAAKPVSVSDANDSAPLDPAVFLYKPSRKWIDKYGDNETTAVCYNLTVLNAITRQQSRQILVLAERLKGFEDALVVDVNSLGKD